MLANRIGFIAALLDSQRAFDDAMML